MMSNLASMNLHPLPRLAIFDLDGTLVEFHHDYLFSEAERIIEHLVHPPTPRELLEECFSAFDFFRFVSDREQEIFIKDFWHAFNWNGFPQTAPISGAVETLEHLSAQGVDIAIVTARLMPEAQVREALSHTNLLSPVKFIYTRPSEEIHWTDKTKMLRQVFAEFDYKPHECMMVGDIPTDVKNARDVGIEQTIAVLTGGIRKDVLEQTNPSLILNHVGEIPERFTTKRVLGGLKG